MNTVLISYASPGFEPYQAINAITGRICGFDDCRAYRPADLADDFVRAHAGILNQPRGAGFWLWKPYLVSRALREVEEGDIVFYSDAAVQFVNPIRPMIDFMRSRSVDLLVLGEGFSDAAYTKRDAFILMECDTERYAWTAQRFASCFMVRMSAWSQDFIERYLRFACDARILTDRPNELGEPNYPGFVDHRHDQSIFSLLTKKLDLPVFSTPFVADGLAARGRQVLNHTRTHVTPGRIIHHLLGERVLTIEHLKEFEQRSPP